MKVKIKSVKYFIWDSIEDSVYNSFMASICYCIEDSIWHIFGLLLVILFGHFISNSVRILKSEWNES